MRGMIWNWNAVLCSSYDAENPPLLLTPLLFFVSGCIRPSYNGEDGNGDLRWRWHLITNSVIASTAPADLL
jgi:hypothetical protein